jgi:predicted nuclease of predicted toxin-antitoxin system
VTAQIKLFLDEHIWEGLVDVLTERGYDVVHINRTEYRGIDDEPLLELAASQGRAVLTFNSKDFGPLIASWWEKVKLATLFGVVGPDGV